MGTRLLTPTKLNAVLSSILISILVPPLTVMMNESLGYDLLMPFFITSEGKKPLQLFNALVRQSTDCHSYLRATSVTDSPFNKFLLASDNFLFHIYSLSVSPER